MNLYYWLRKKIAANDEKESYSSGPWPRALRLQALDWCQEGYDNILEVGCGEGLLLVKIAEKLSLSTVFGLDINSFLLDQARERALKEGINNIRFFLSQGQQMPFSANYFDTIVCINVFFNLPSYSDVLAEMSRVCKPGGVIIFDIRNRLNPLLYFKYKLAGLYDPTTKELPLCTYSLGEINQSLEYYGFGIKQKKYLGFPYNMFAPLILIEAVKK
jgi:ubiquinone/menaquinone biosynthesis C-methylase UbiE